MRYVIAIVCCTVYAFWDGVQNDGVYTRAFFAEVTRVVSLIF